MLDQERKPERHAAASGAANVEESLTAESPSFAVRSSYRRGRASACRFVIDPRKRVAPSFCQHPSAAGLDSHTPRPSDA